MSSPDSKTSPTSPTDGSLKESTSLHSVSNISTGKTVPAIVDLILASGSKGEALVSVADGSSGQVETSVGDKVGGGASKSLQSIIRKSSNVSLGSTTARSETETAKGVADQIMHCEEPSLIPQKSTTVESTTSTPSFIAAPLFIGTVLEGHVFTAVSPTITPENTSKTESTSYQTSSSPQDTPLEQPTNTNKENTNESRSSLGVLTTWWYGNTTSPDDPTNSNNSPSHEETHKELSATTSTSTASNTILPSSLLATASPGITTLSGAEAPDSMDWEPSGPEARLIQEAEARKQNTKNPSSSSLPSSFSPSATFPASMVKHNKALASSRGRRGSASSTQGLLASILWSKLAANHDNKAATEPSTPIRDTDPNQTSPATTPQEQLPMETETSPSSSHGLAIAPTHAEDLGGTSSQTNSSKKRWSLFGYGAKEGGHETVQPNKLRKSGDVLIESESRPASVKEAQKGVQDRDSLDDEKSSVAGSSTVIVGSASEEALAHTPTSVKTELAHPSEESKSVAPALVGTSDVNIVFPPGAAVSESKNKSTGPNSNGTVSSTYSWLSIIPGYGNKTEEATTSSESPDSNYQETDAEEDENKTMSMDEKSTRRTLAELVEAKRTKKALATKEDSIDSYKGPTLSQFKDRDSSDGGIIKEAGKAAASLSKVIFRKKNVVLPDYYEQYPDVRQSLLTMPIGHTDVSIEEPKHERSSSIMKSAVNAISSLLFSKSAAATPSDPAASKNDALHQGANGIKKVAIIGVHGWFPVKLIRTVIGEPTGTSKKFCDEMDLALKDYLKMHDVDLAPEDITLIPLEGEGKVMSRVEILYENLVRNGAWLKALREADVVLIATHSQGTPTSALLTARLIDKGMLRVREDDPKMQRVGILAMAGISHGPFAFLKGNLIVRWFEAEAAQELFEFMDSDSEIAKKYREALEVILTSGVRLTLVASMEDQVVPLYSAVMTAVHHPSIVRAVYIDGASYQDDFLTNLISFSLRLRNSGMNDHGVLVHLSEAVAGSIYGEGHSTIYEEREVYMLAIRALLEPPESLTSEMIRSEPIFSPFRAKQGLNPFYLPWGMRGVIDEIRAMDNEVLNKEVERLKKLYDEWNPVSKTMKEIKFRLEPVRSKL